jgi:hypothetical protein
MTNSRIDRWATVSAHVKAAVKAGLGRGGLQDNQKWDICHHALIH